MSNFAFLPNEFRDIAESATKAEGHIMSDPRAACFHARFSLEAAVHWLYRHDPSLRMPYDHSLGALLHDPSFQNLLPQAVFQKARVIQKVGNQAVHNARPVRQYDALQTVKELHHICYWLLRTYAPDASRAEVAWRDDLVPKPLKPGEAVPRQELEKLEARLAEQNERALKQQQERDALDAELQKLREQLAKIRAQAEATPDTHDYSEAQTRRYLIDVDLHRAGWPLDQQRDREYEVSGMPNNKGLGYVDYVLWGDDGKPLAVVEAKKTTVAPAVGQQQAKLYADCLEQMHGQRPLIFYTNGYETWLWDDLNYPNRRVAGLYKKDELQRLILRRTQKSTLDVAQVKDAIVERYYQKRAIGSIFAQFDQARRKALLVMATGTGKTRTAIALVDVLQRAGWVKRALFLADRVSLVNQAVGAFKAHLPESSPVNLVTEKDTEGRVYVCTYPTMLNLIDQSDGGVSRFGVGHFDLVIIDEAHRSVYQKYGAIFKYFDSLLVGLTATPREEVDKNTYDLFELEPGVPTDAYELDRAVSDGFLVPPRVQQVDLKYPQKGIHYDELSKEEQEQWEGLDWGDNVNWNDPKKIEPGAVNSWLFNADTIDKVLQYLMEHGHKVDGGDRLAKTILFARNHDHAIAVEGRFNHHYPHFKGHFARVIDNQAKYPQSLIDDFGQKEKAPHIAISVDMLDTGIDVPEVANLVFFKPVYSKIKFWQMIGRGTRLCPDLFAPGEDKQDFRIFDFCANFDFFRENPEGIKGSDSASLSTRLFRARVELLALMKHDQTLDPEKALGSSLKGGLQTIVSAMNPENFIVRMHLKAVERFQNPTVWEALGDDDYQTLHREMATLPTEQENDAIEARRFDMIALRMQLALAQGEKRKFEKLRVTVVEIAELLQEKTTIPAIREQLAYLQAMQDPGFWEGVNLHVLEEMRLRLRELIHFLDRQTKGTLVYSDFEDEILEVRDEEVIYMPKMTSVQYEKKVNDYLRNHLDHLVIHRLRSNQPLTETDLQGLEQTLAEIGNGDGLTLLSNLLERSGAPSLPWFVRSLVGMDRTAAQQAFSKFLGDRSLTGPQIRFVEMIIDQLTARGVMGAAALYEPPFNSLHAGGPDALFAGKDNVIEGIFETLQQVHSELAVGGG